MNALIDKYTKAAPLQLPVEHPDGFKLTNTTVECKQCNKSTEDLKGTITIHPTCIEVEAAGICHQCRAVTWARFRWYGTHLLHWSDTGIRTLHTTTSWWRSLRKFLKL